MTSKPVTHSNQKGFTLIEIAIVIIIAGILLAFLGDALTNYLKNNRIETTEYRLEQIKKSLSQYLSINGSYPCPASRNLAADAANFGQGQPATCTGAAPAGTNDVGAVRIGAVPVRDLNLPDEYAADAWGNKFTYAVSENIANTTTPYDPADGRIVVLDSGGARIIPTAAGAVNDGNPGAHFVVVSHGESGAGGVSLNGAGVSVPCNAGALDGENCDHANRTFTITLVNSDAAAFYDDYAIYQGQTEPNAFIPPGMVAAFDNTVATPTGCPDGWTLFNPAVNRVIMGTTIAGGSRTLNQMQAQVALPAHNHGGPNGGAANVNVPITFTGAGQVHDIDILDTEGDDPTTSAIPPYVALIYCRKD